MRKRNMKKLWINKAYTDEQCGEEITIGKAINYDEQFIFEPQEVILVSELNKELDIMKEAIHKVEKENSETGALLVAYLEIQRIRELS
jgi:hypothetical protein